MDFEKSGRWISNLGLTALAGYALFLHLSNPAALDIFCFEDGLIEWLTALFYLLAAVIFIYASRWCGLKNIWYWGFVFLFLIVAGEEISWGQRIFNFATPKMLGDINVQAEASFHNIEGIHGSIRAVGLIFIAGICYFIPLTDRFVGWLGRFYRKIRLPIYPLWSITLPTIGILFMLIPRLFFGEIIFNLDEIGEIYLSAGFLVFSLSEYNLAVKTKKGFKK